MSAVSTTSLLIAGAALLALSSTAGVVTYIVERCIIRAGVAYYAVVSFGLLVHASWLFGVGVRAGAGVDLAGSAIAALLAGWLWRRRPPRKRRPSKVAGRVRDLGHRLTTAPVTAS